MNELLNCVVCSDRCTTRCPNLDTSSQWEGESRQKAVCLISSSELGCSIHLGLEAHRNLRQVFLFRSSRIWGRAMNKSKHCATAVLFLFFGGSFKSETEVVLKMQHRVGAAKNKRCTAKWTKFGLISSSVDTAEGRVTVICLTHHLLRVFIMNCTLRHSSSQLC